MNGEMTTVRDGLGMQTSTRHETQGEAQGARAQAMVQARFVVALQRPRDLDEVRLALLKECRRPNFATVARWERQQGPDLISGWSIRFVESAVRCMRHLECQTETLFDSRERRIVRCSAIDYESGSSWSHEVTIEKTKERKYLKEGDVPLSQRRNSYGDLVYLLPATDDEVRTKEGALVSKALRTLGLRLIPGDLLDEAAREIARTLADADAADPEGERKRLIDGFAELGIRPAALVEYLGGKPLDALTPADRSELRGVYACVRDGERWEVILEASPHRQVEETAKKPKNAASEKLRTKLEARRKPKAQRETSAVSAATLCEAATAASDVQTQSAESHATSELGG